MSEEGDIYVSTTRFDRSVNIVFRVTNCRVKFCNDASSRIRTWWHFAT